MYEDLVAAKVSPGPLATTILEGSRTDLLRWLSTTTDPANCAPSIVSIAAPEFQVALEHASVIADTIKNDNIRWAAKASMDHVFEKNWLLGFLESIIDPNAQSLATLSQYYNVRRINCNDLHNYFFGPQRTRNDLGDLFNAMPGGDANFLSLAGITKGMNEDSKVMCPNRLAAKMHVANVATV